MNEGNRYSKNYYASITVIWALTIMLIFSSCSSADKTRLSATARVWNTDNLKAFEKKLESLRKRDHVPSISAGIVNSKKLAWKQGLGLADLENSIKPDENTVYHLASITKTFGSIILMQEVEAGKVSLEDPIANYGIDLGARWGSDERIKVKHLLTHTSQGNSLNIFKPGYSFRYNGDFYGRLKLVIEKSSGVTFGELMVERIIHPLGLKNTAPSLGDSNAFGVTKLDRNSFVKNLAKPYEWRKGKFTSTEYRTYFGPSAGLMSSVSDLATYSIAIDEGKFLKPETWQKIFTPAVSEKGKVFQYGLGWFIKDYKGVKVVWHTGLWNGCSALLVKIPEKDLALILLANSSGMRSSLFQILNPFARKLNRNLKASPYGRAFLKSFAGL